MEAVVVTYTQENDWIKINFILKLLILKWFYIKNITTICVLIKYSNNNNN
jgi:hypothetical protein